MDRQAVDAQVGDLAAPAAVRTAPAPTPPAPTIEATSIAKGIWFLRGAGNSVLFEFDDHLTLFEVYATLAAYIGVKNTGQGQYVDAALFDAAMAFSVWDICDYWGTGIGLYVTF